MQEPDPRDDGTPSPIPEPERKDPGEPQPIEEPQSPAENAAAAKLSAARPITD